LTTELPDELRLGSEVEKTLVGRTMIVRKATVVPFECVVRGYLEGSGWKEYQASGSVCGIPLPPGLVQCGRLPEPIFTPATKAESGHDENVTFEAMQTELPKNTAQRLRALSLEIYSRASARAAEVGLIIADTKFEFGFDGETLLLIDEVLTPDSSRFWPAEQYQPGRAQASYDKQYVREWLMASDWDRNSPPPALPAAVIEKTRQKYIQARDLLVPPSVFHYA
jgi:phosphoribosylaminoimidazole-succinocarboxamide synthase